VLGHGLIRAKTVAFRQLASMIAAGVTLSEALSVISQRCSEPRLRRSLQRAAKATSEGQRLSEVFAKEPDLYPPVTMAMIEAAETSGRLEEVLSRLADYYERDYQLRMMLSRETFYPKLLALGIILIPTAGAAIRIWLLKNAAAAVVYLLTRLLFWALVLLLPGLAIWAVWKSLAQSETGRASLDRLKLRVPLLGKVVYKLAMARFARALAALYGGGVTMARALRLAGEATANAALREIADRAAEQVQTGTSLTEAMANSGLRDDMMLSMLRTGEQTGELEGTMLHIAEYYEDEAQTAARQMAVAIVPIAVVIAGIVVALMVVQFYVGQLYGPLLK